MGSRNELRVGLVGRRATAFIPGLRSRPEVHVAALCELDAQTLQSLADRHDIPGRYVDYAEMLDLASLDAVIVGTPMNLHVPQSILALDRGLHVLSEVTAAISLDECAPLVAAVRRSSGRYMLAENYCYTRQSLLVKHLARLGLFGELYYAEGAYVHDCHSIHYDAAGNPTWRVEWQVGRNGCTYGTHSLGPALEWLGERLVSVTCLGSGVHTEPRHKLDDTVTMLGKTPSGALVNVRVDMQSHRPHNMTHYALQGTKGAYQSARRPGEPDLVWIEGRSPGRETWQDLAEYESEFLPEPWRSLGAEASRAGHGGGDFFVVRDWVASTVDGTEPPIDVYRALDFTVPGLVSERSIASGGQPVDVPDFRLGS